MIIKKEAKSKRRNTKRNINNIKMGTEAEVEVHKGNKKTKSKLKGNIKTMTKLLN